jgi:hypothetical protein
LYDAQSYHDTLPVRIFPEEIVTNPGNLPIRTGAADAGAIHIGQTVTMAAQKELAGMGEKSYNEGDKYCGGYGAQMGCVKITGLKGAQNELF